MCECVGGWEWEDGRGGWELEGMSGRVRGWEGESV